MNALPCECNGCTAQLKPYRVQVKPGEVSQNQMVRIEPGWLVTQIECPEHEGRAAFSRLVVICPRHGGAWNQ